MPDHSLSVDNSTISEESKAAPHYSFWQSLIQKLSSTRPGAWFMSRLLHHVDRVFLRLTKGRTTITHLGTGLPVVILTTRGARSGLLRRTPLVAIRDPAQPGQIALIASNFGQHHHPAWYYNLKADPHASCSISGQLGRYTAHEARDDEYQRYWHFAAQTFHGYDLYKQRTRGRHIPIMVLMPE